MAVLKNFSGQWSLFLVLEMLGLSIILAVFSVKVTKNDTAVGGDEARDDDHCKSLLEGGCGVYAWSFILQTMPLAFTLCALLLASFISNGDSIIFVRVFQPLSWTFSLMFSVLLLGWLGAESLWHIDANLAVTLNIVQGVLTAVCLAIVFCWPRGREAWETYVGGTERYSARDRDLRRLFVWFGTGTTLSRVILEIVPLCLSAGGREDFYDGAYDPAWIVLYIGDVIVQLVIYAWIVVGMRLPARATPTKPINADRIDGTSDAADESFATGVDTCAATAVDSAAGVTTSDATVFLNSAIPMLLGWGSCNGVFVIYHLVVEESWKLTEQYPNSMAWPLVLLLDRMFWLAWLIISGTWLRSAFGIGNMAYWNAATLLSWEVMRVFWGWGVDLDSGAVL